MPSVEITEEHLRPSGEVTRQNAGLARSALDAFVIELKIDVLMEASNMVHNPKKSSLEALFGVVQNKGYNKLDLIIYVLFFGVTFILCNSRPYL